MSLDLRLNPAYVRQAALQHVVPIGITVVFVSLALTFGGYHPRHWGVGAIAVALLLCWTVAQGKLATLRSPAGAAIAAGAALTVWTATSWMWAEYSRHNVWDETNRTLLYVACVALGTTTMAWSRSLERCAGWLCAGFAATALVTIWRIANPDTLGNIFASGRLDFPIGYANGAAAFFSIGMLLLCGAAVHLIHYVPQQRPHHIVARNAQFQQRYTRVLQVGARVGAGLAVACAGICLQLAVLAQSRGAVIAIIPAIAISYAATSQRWTLGIIHLTLLATTSAAIGPLGDPYTRLTAARVARDENRPGASELQQLALAAVREAATTILWAAVITGVCGLTLAAVAHWKRAHPRRKVFAPSTARLVGQVVAIAACTVLIIGGGSKFNAGSWLQLQGNACRTAAFPPDNQAPQQQVSAGSHFGDVGSNRCDFWRVSLRGWAHNPIAGIGANNFGGYYAQHRNSDELPRQSHSLPLQFVGELGFVGIILVLVGIWTLAVAVARFLSSGSRRSALFAGATAAIVYWLVHSSVDWLWNLPAVTIPVMVLAGGMIACVSPAQRNVNIRASRMLAAGLAVITCAMVLPQVVADMSYRTSRDPETIHNDRSAARHAAVRAGNWDPTWAAPAVQLAGLYFGERNVAAMNSSLKTALAREPQNWVVHAASANMWRRAAAWPGTSARVRQQRLARAKSARKKALDLNPRMKPTN